MTPEFESNVLQWIEEQVAVNPTGSATSIAVVQLLMMRMALESRATDENLTKSTEISLKAFERANLHRTVRTLERKRFIDFADSKGNPLSQAEQQAIQSTLPTRSEPLYVALTERGVRSWRV